MKIKNVLIGVGLVLAGASPGAYREITRPTSAKLVQKALEACQDAGTMKGLCMFIQVAEECSSDKYSPYLDLKVCGLVQQK